MLALDSDTGKEMWTAAMEGPIGAGSERLWGDGILFVPTGKGVGGSIVAFGLPSTSVTTDQNRYTSPDTHVIVARLGRTYWSVDRLILQLAPS